MVIVVESSLALSRRGSYSDGLTAEEDKKGPMVMIYPLLKKMLSSPFPSSFQQYYVGYHYIQPDFPVARCLS